MKLLLIDTINTYVAHWSGPWSAPRMPIGRPLTPPASDLAPALRGAVLAPDQSDVPNLDLQASEPVTFTDGVSLGEATPHAPVPDVASALRGAVLASGQGDSSSRTREAPFHAGGADE